MEEIEKQSKKLEALSLQHDPVYPQLLEVIPIIKKFIADKQLIVYGGTAIDYALRLKGDCIYPDDMLMVPDLDFYSPNSVSHAYELADILYAAGYKDVRTIRALYVTTMRVDVTGNHWIADITYINKEIFDKLPTIKYEDMLIIHPDFQRIDLHRALAFPFENAPREAVFQREVKYIERFNILDNKYPITNPFAKSPEPKGIKKQLEIPASYAKKVITGVAAHAILLQDLKDLAAKFKATVNFKDIIDDVIELTVDNNLSLPTLNSIVEFIDHQPEKIVADDIHKFEAFMSILPKHILYNEKCGKYRSNIKVYNMKNKLSVVNSSEIRNKKGDKKQVVRHANVQLILYMFLSNSYVEEVNKDTETRDYFIAYYVSTMRIIEEAEKIIAKTTDPETIALHSPFYPTLNVYGSDNYSEAYEILYRGIEVDHGTKTPFYMPANYTPSRGKAPPTFDYDKSKFFRKRGFEIKN